MKRASAYVLIGAVIVALIVAMSVYTIDQRKAAIKFQLGEVKAIQTEPGLYFLVPLLQNVRLFDTRIQTLEARDPQRFLTAENRNVLVDSFVKWRIVDVRQFYVSVAQRGDAILAAESRISQTVNDALRAEFARKKVHDVVSGEREKIMLDVAKKVDADVRRIGVQVVDVRLKRVDFKGEGDAQASRIYAEAFQRNPEFYSFYRSMEAYRQSLRSKSDVMVLDPSSDFFKYLKSPGRGNKSSGQ